MMPGLDTLDVLRCLQQACYAAGGQSVFATRVGVSQQLVCDVLNGRRELSPKILAALNLRKVVRYMPTNGGGGMMRVLSLGAGVQSSTIALMSARGDLPKLDCAIFADTGGEPTRVYEWLDWLEAQLPYPVIRVRRVGVDLGELSTGVASGALPRGPIPPWYLRSEDGSMSMLPKQCSKEFKTRVVQAEIRRLVGLNPRERAPADLRVEQWLGISLDEAHRMKPSELAWIDNRWPLIDARMSRRACLGWLEERQYPRPPRSSCIYCPFRGDEEWRDMRDNTPEDWASVVEFDRTIRPGWPGMTGAAFVHRSGLPLDQVDLSTWADRGQPDLFGGECEGVCGV